MHHQVYGLLLCMSFSLCADANEYDIADKSQRIGRFSYEDSFDENVIENILKHSPANVNKNIKKLLYPSTNEEIPQRLLLLGKVSNASLTAIAKAIALRCGYEYYVIEASILLRACREGRHILLLNEVNTIIKSGKPIALIITELPEMVDYSGLLTSTLWLLIDQCTQYQDVLFIATSGFYEKQLSHEIKELFAENIISISIDKSIQQRIKAISEPKKSWIEKYKGAFIAAGFVCCALATGYAIIQMLSIVEQIRKQWEDEKRLLEQRIVGLNNDMKFVTEENNKQEQLFRDQLIDIQKQLNELAKEKFELQQRLGQMSYQQTLEELKLQEQLRFEKSYQQSLLIDDYRGDLTYWMLKKLNFL